MSDTGNESILMKVHLFPVSFDALNAEAKRSGLSRTDVVNRALQVYAAVMRAEAATRVSVSEMTGELALQLVVERGGESR